MRTCQSWRCTRRFGMEALSCSRQGIGVRDLLLMLMSTPSPNQMIPWVQLWWTHEAAHCAPEQLTFLPVRGGNGGAQTVPKAGMDLEYLAFHHWMKTPVYKEQSPNDPMNKSEISGGEKTTLGFVGGRLGAWTRVRGRRPGDAVWTWMKRDA